MKRQNKYSYWVYFGITLLIVSLQGCETPLTYHFRYQTAQYRSVDGAYEIKQGPPLRSSCETVVIRSSELVTWLDQPDSAMYKGFAACSDKLTLSSDSLKNRDDLLTVNEIEQLRQPMQPEPPPLYSITINVSGTPDRNLSSGNLRNGRFKFNQLPNLHEGEEATQNNTVPSAAQITQSDFGDLVSQDYFYFILDDIIDDEAILSARFRYLAGGTSLNRDLLVVQDGALLLKIRDGTFFD